MSSVSRVYTPKDAVNNHLLILTHQSIKHNPQFDHNTRKQVILTLPEMEVNSIRAT